MGKGENLMGKSSGGNSCWLGVRSRQGIRLIWLNLTRFDLKHVYSQP